MAKGTWQRKGPTPRPMWDRFWEKVEVGDGCWNWTASCSPNGYGKWKNRVGHTHTTRSSHRVAYEMLVGPIPKGMTLDHLCRNRRCVNPTHLEPVSQRENVLRSPTAPPAVNARKTHCPQGHSYSGVAITGQRICNRCQADASRRYKQRQPK